MSDLALAEGGMGADSPAPEYPAAPRPKRLAQPAFKKLRRRIWPMAEKSSEENGAFIGETWVEAEIETVRRVGDVFLRQVYLK